MKLFTVWFLNLFLVAMPLIGVGQIKPMAKKGRTRAVVVGVSQYKNDRIPDLQYADKDAEAFAEYLRSAQGGGVSEADLRVLTNENATCGNLGAELSWLLDESKEGDLAIIYFSGHGDMERPPLNYSVLLTHESPASMYMGGGAFPLDLLQLIVQSLSVEKKVQVLLIADACHSGNLAGSAMKGTTGLAKALSVPLGDEFKILSCQPHEFSKEGKKWGGGHGLFTYYLIKGLLGEADVNKDYSVTLLELERYLGKEVPEEALPDSQIPVVLASNKSSEIAKVDESVLDAIRDKLKEPAEQANEAVNDSLIWKRYDQFLLALQKKHLLFPNESSAYAIYMEIKDEEVMREKESEMRRKLIAALQDEAQQAINDYLEADPRELRLRWQHDGRYENYPIYLERAAELVGESHFLYKTLQARSLYFKGLNMRMQGERDKTPELYAEAEALQKHVLELQPNAAYAYNELGLLARRQSAFEQSVSYFELALTQSPTWVLAHTNLCASYNNLDEYKKGIEACKSALYFDSTFALAHYNLGSIYSSQGDYKNAIEAYRKSIQYNPDYAQNYFKLGNALYFEGQQQEAKSMWILCTMKDPKYPVAFKNLGEVSLDDGNLSEAEIWFRGAVQADPNYGSGLYMLSVVLSMQNRTQEAIDALKGSLDAGYKIKKAEILEEEAFKSMLTESGFQQVIQSHFPE
ncbi:MAG: caspase family protein [Saprospiraceae bacterium]